MARRDTGGRSRHRLKGLRGGQAGWALPPLAKRKKASSSHATKEAKTEAFSDTYPLRTKANRACGEAPRTSVPTGAAKGCPATDFGAAPTSGARGAEGAAYPGVAAAVGGSTSCTAVMGACP
jgi:hypothetical protein